MLAFFKNFFTQDCKNDKDLFQKALLYTLFLGLLAHAYNMFHLQPYHDGLHELFRDYESWLHQFRLGRVFEPLYTSLFNHKLTIPLITGLFSILWIGMAVYFMAKIFSIRRALYLFLIAGILISNVSMIVLHVNYLPWLAHDSFALFSMILAVYFWHCKPLKSWQNFLLSSIFILLGFGIYQAMLSIYVSLVAICILMDLLKQGQWADSMKRTLQAILILLFAMLAYYISLQLVKRFFSIELYQNSYNSIQQISNHSEKLLSRLEGCYLHFYDYLFEYDRNVYGLAVWRTLSFLSIVCSVLFLGIILFQRTRKPLHILLSLAIAASFPILFSLTRLVSYIIHDLMILAYQFIYIFPLLLLANFKEDIILPKFLSSLSTLVVAAYLYINIQTANFVYVQKDIEFQSTRSFVSTALSGLSLEVDYTEGQSEVLLVGVPKFRSLDFKFTISNNLNLHFDNPVSFSFYWKPYIDDILRRRIKLYEGSALDSSNPSIRNMPSYPNKGYMQVIDGVYVIKFSD